MKLVLRQPGTLSRWQLALADNKPVQPVRINSPVGTMDHVEMVDGDALSKSADPPDSFQQESVMLLSEMLCA